MKLILLVFTSSIIFSSLNFSQVVVDSININTSFYGPFNRTTAEIYFKNISNRDSLEGQFNFTINKSSIITNLWLQIKNKMKKAETFGRRTGTNIYRQITRRKIDPVLLYKYNEGRYSLRIFPVRQNKSKKVVIEYYSILETDTSGFPAWYFNSSQIEDVNKSLTIESRQPKNTLEYFKYLNKDAQQVAILTKKSNAKIQKTFNADRFYLVFNYKYNFNNALYYNNNSRFQQTIRDMKVNHAQKQKSYFKINVKEMYIPQALKKLLKIVKHGFSTTVDVLGYDEMTYEFLNYLTIKNNLILNTHNINTDRIDDKHSWYNNYDKMIYIDSNFSLIPIIRKNKTINNSVRIYCPFLDIYGDYLESLLKPFLYQEKKGYLNSRLSKIVIEDDKRAQAIKEHWVNIEKRSEPNKVNNIEEEPMYFIAVEEMPEPNGGIKFFEDRLFYPKEDKSLDGNHKIYVKTMVNKIGKPIRIEIVKSDDSLLSKISRFVVSLSNWKPGKQRGKPVVVTVMIPIKFYSDSVKKGSNKKQINMYLIGNKKFKIKIKDNKCLLLENNYNEEQAEDIKFRSEMFFDLLYKHPQFIETVYKAFYLSKLDGLGISFINKRQKRVNYFISN